jgi:heat shock protein HspQ
VYPSVGNWNLPQPYEKRDGCLPKHLYEQYIEIYASKEMMEDFNRLIAFTYYLGANVTGGCLITPYKGYVVRKDSYGSIGNMQWKLAKQTSFSSQKQPVHRLLFDRDDTPHKHYTTEQFYEYCDKVYERHTLHLTSKFPA